MAENSQIDYYTALKTAGAVPLIATAITGPEKITVSQMAEKTVNGATEDYMNSTMGILANQIAGASTENATSSGAELPTGKILKKAKLIIPQGTWTVYYFDKGITYLRKSDFLRFANIIMKAKVNPGERSQFWGGHNYELIELESFTVEKVLEKRGFLSVLKYEPEDYPTVLRVEQFRPHYNNFPSSLNPYYTGELEAVKAPEMQVKLIDILEFSKLHFGQNTKHWRALENAIYCIQTQGNELLYPFEDVEVAIKFKKPGWLESMNRIMTLGLTAVSFIPGFGQLAAVLGVLTAVSEKPMNPTTVGIAGTGAAIEGVVDIGEVMSKSAEFLKVMKEISPIVSIAGVVHSEANYVPNNVVSMTITLSDGGGVYCYEITYDATTGDIVTMSNGWGDNAYMETVTPANLAHYDKYFTPKIVSVHFDEVSKYSVYVPAEGATVKDSLED